MEARENAQPADAIQVQSALGALRRGLTSAETLCCPPFMKPPATPDPTRFEELGLVEPLLQAIREEGYTAPTPIQARAIPHALAGQDLMGCAQTGTGKTAAFALPILQRLMRVPPPKPRHIRALILSPTRGWRARSTVVRGVRPAFGNAARWCTAAWGGSPTKAIRAGVGIRCAPGRSSISWGRIIRLNGVRCWCWTRRTGCWTWVHLRREADIARFRSRARRSSSRRAVTRGTDLARRSCEPLRIGVAPSARRWKGAAVGVFRGEEPEGRLLEQILRDPSIVRVLVFTKTKHGANHVAEELNRGPVRADVIHSNRSQSARERSLESFRTGETRVLVATDIAARGIDVDGITHVVNYDVPHESEVYVHRIGRTARAGAAGVALTLCDRDERHLLLDIEKLIRMKIPEVGPHPAGPGAAVSGPAPAAPHHHAAPHHAAHTPAHGAPHHAVSHHPPQPAAQPPSTRGRLRQRRYNPR